MSSVITDDIVDAMWDCLTTRKDQAFVRAVPHDEALAVLDISEAGPLSHDSQHGRKTAQRGAYEGSPPTADLGTAEAGNVPNGARYFTVKLHAQGRTHYRHLEAKHDLHANQLAQAPSVTYVKFVREIDRAEFERLTK